MRSEALEDGCGGFLVADDVGEWHDAVGLRDRMRGVGGGENPGHAVADFQVGDAGAERLNDPRALATERLRQIALVESAAQLRIEKIYAGGFHLDQHLASARLRQRQLVEPHRFDAAVFVHSDGFDHGVIYAIRRQRGQNVKSSASGVALKYASRNSPGLANVLCRSRLRIS